MRSTFALALGVLLAASAAIAPAADQNSIWNGTTGNWTDIARWNTLTFPNNGGFTYDATVSAGSVNLDQNIVIQKFIFSGGTLAGTSAFTLTLVETSEPAFNWTGGVVSGLGSLDANGITMSGVNGKSLSGSRVLINDGIANFSGGVLNIFSSGGAAAGAIFDNNVTFNANDDADIVLQNVGGNQPTFVNDGTFNKATAGTTTSVGVVFNSAGTVAVSGGMLSLNGGGTGSGGFSAGASGTLNFGGSYTLGGSSIVSGAGTIANSAGTLTVNGSYAPTGSTSINGGTFTLNTVSASSGSATLSSGALTGTGTLGVTGNFNWTGGTQSGTGTTTVGGIFTISGASAKTISGNRHITSGGTGSFSGGTLTMSTAVGAAPILENDGTFSITDDADIALLSIGGSVPSVQNDLTFNKSGGGTITSIAVLFNNNGTANVDSGTLTLSGGGSGNGDFAIDSSATLNFSGTHTLGGDLSVDSGGALNFTGGSQSLGASSTVSGAGTVSVSGGTVTVAGGYNPTGSTTVNGGTLTLNSVAASTGSLNLNNAFSVLSGSAPLNVTGNLSWTAGTMSGTGSTAVAGTSTISGSSGKILAGSRAFTNNGTGNVSGSGLDIRTSGSGAPGPVLNNDGILNVTDEADFVLTNVGGSAPDFINNGTFNKSGAGTTTTVSVAFNTPGIVNVNSGTLNITGTHANRSGGALSGGTYRVTDSGVTSTFAAPGPAVTTIGGSAAVRLSGTNSNMTFGGTNLAASLTTNNGTLQIYNGRSFTMTNPLANAGGLELGGAGLADATLTSATVTNSTTGTISGHGTIVGDVTNDGAVSPGSSPGILSITGDYTQGSTGTLFIELAGTNPATDFDRLLVSDTLTLAGTLDVDLLSFSPQENDFFDILNWGTRIDTFTTVSLPTLDPGLTWNTDDLYVTGIISVDGAVDPADADFDDDSDIDADDVDLLADIIFRGASDPGGQDTADLDGVGGVTQDDMDYMINTVLETVFGDADLDDDVDGADFDAWRIRDSLGGGIGWATGDWDGDNDVDGADFDHWRLRLPSIGGAGGGVAAVPEPASWFLMSVGGAALVHGIRRRKV